MMIRYVRVFLIAAALASSSTSIAQEAPAVEKPQAQSPAAASPPSTRAPTRAQLRHAREAYQRGAKHQEQAEYEQAIQAYEEAYDLSQNPALWFNIGQAYRLWGKRTQAIDYYQKYLAAEPNGQAAAEAYGNIQALTAELNTVREAQERALAEERARKAQLAVQRIQARDAEDKRRRQALQAQADERNAIEARRARKYRLAGIASAGAGVLLSAVGAVFHGKAASKEDDIAAAQGEWSTALDQAVTDGEAAERNALIFYGTGGLAIATGAGLYLMGHFLRPREQERVLTIAPAASPGSAGVVLGLSF